MTSSMIGCFVIPYLVLCQYLLVCYHLLVDRPSQTGFLLRCHRLDIINYRFVLQKANQVNGINSFWNDYNIRMI